MGAFSDEYAYGRRQHIRYDKTGQPSYRYSPLSLLDFLNPQEGDEFAHGQLHDELVRELVRVFHYFHRYNPTTLVVSGLKLNWGVATLSQPAPDLAIIPNVVEIAQPRSHFDVQQEQTQPRFVLEVTSPIFAALDLVDKVALYAQAGVAEYFIVDVGQAPACNPLRILGYRLAGDHYLPIAPDADGRLLSTTNRLWLTLTPTGDRIRLLDQRSGQEIVPEPDYEHVSAAALGHAALRASSIAAQLQIGA